MPFRRPGTTATLARFCLSSLGTVACWALWIVLGALLAVEIYIAAAHDLPVPALILRRIESRLADANLTVSFTRAQFDPTGKVFVQAVRLRSRQFEDPLLTCQSLYLRKSVWSYLAGQHAPDEIRLEGGTLQLPALLSPSGTAEPLLRDINATLRIERNLLHVDQLNFRAGNLIVTARGDLQLPPATAAGGDPALLIGQALQYGRRLVRELPRLETLEHPVLDLVLENRPGVGNVAELHLRADALRLDSGELAVLHHLDAHSTLRLDSAESRPLRLTLSADRAMVRDTIAAERLRGVLATEISTRLTTPPRTALLLLAAERVAGFDEQIDHPTLQLTWQDRQPLRFELGTRVHGETFAFRGEADLARKSGRLQFDGRVPPSLVDAVLPKRTPKLAPYFRFGDPVEVHAEATFSEGWRFELLRSRVRVQRMDSHGVQVTSARGLIDLDRQGNFLAYDALARIGENYGRGSYFMNFRTWDYRFLLEGALQPASISGWFRSDWWLKFWESNFAFPAAPPAADVDVTGNWRDVTQVSYFGSTDAVSPRVLGADFERAHARVFVRPQFAHAFDLRVERAGGTQRASGWFKRFADTPTRELRRLEFDLAGNLDAAALRPLGRETAETLLKPWSFTSAPEIHFWGATDYRDGRSVPELKFRGAIRGGVRYEHFPLESVEAEGSASGTDVRLDRLLLGVAGGRGTAQASYTGADGTRKLGFDFYIENADMVQAIRAIHEFEVARGNLDPNASPNRDLLKRASGGKLQFALSASGNPDDIASFVGSGNVQLAGAELGEVHLFGLLSQLLSSLSLNFSSLKLDTLRASYKLAHGVATFPDVRITGPTALIEGKGDYRLTDKSLDFTARFKPYEENKSILQAAIGIVVNPLASILELRLTGPIQKPHWSVSFLSSGSSAPAPQSPSANPGPPSASASPAATPPANTEPERKP